MPSLSDALSQDLSMYTSVENDSIARDSVTVRDLQPTRNTAIRCPLPPIFQAAPDNLRQFYQDGAVPQVRIFSPSISGQSGGASGGNGSVTVSGGSASGGGTSGGTTQPVAQSASLTTGSLIPNQVYTGSFQVSKSFVLLNLSVNSPTRIQLYGSAAARTQDSARAMDVSPPAGTTQGIICDVVLDTAPYQWTFQDRVGSNSDDTQTSTIYVSMTNIDVVSDTITLTLGYVPIES